MSDPSNDISNRMSQFFQAIAPPARLEILLALGGGEACVCHLEAVTGYRQAYISQHLMALRDAGVIEARRQGRYIYYRLQDVAILGLLASAGKLCGLSPAELSFVAISDRVEGCDCPRCLATSPVSLLQIGLPEATG